MAEISLIIPGLAGRYATALFDLARDQKALETVDASVAVLAEALAVNQDLQQLIVNPVISRHNGTKAIRGVAEGLGLDPLVAKFLGVLAQNRRLAALPAILKGFRALLAHHRGETSAEVTSAQALDPGQLTALTAKLRMYLGREVTVSTRLDPTILGGLVVRIGSKLIDSSLKTKLDQLALIMKTSGLAPVQKG